MNENQTNETNVTNETKENETKQKRNLIYRLKKDKKFRKRVIIVAIVLVLLSPMSLRLSLNFGSWHEVHENSKSVWVNEGKIKFYSNGVWTETYSDGSGSDGEWELLNDYTLIYDDGYHTTYYNFGEWFYIGTHLFLGDDYQFTRLPFLYPKH